MPRTSDGEETPFRRPSRRLTEGELDGVHPKVIVIMAGMNNGRTPHDGLDTAVVESVANGMRAILDVT